LRPARRTVSDLTLVIERPKPELSEDGDDPRTKGILYLRGFAVAVLRHFDPPSLSV
jgi:hypothetical protein